MTITDNVYICAAGETFDSVALYLFGDEKYAAELLCVNPELSTKSIFDGTEKLNIPYISIPESGRMSLPEIAPWRSE